MAESKSWKIVVSSENCCRLRREETYENTLAGFRATGVHFNSSDIPDYAFAVTWEPWEEGCTAWFYGRKIQSTWSVWNLHHPNGARKFVLHEEIALLPRLTWNPINLIPQEFNLYVQPGKITIKTSGNNINVWITPKLPESLWRKKKQEKSVNGKR